MVDARDAALPALDAGVLLQGNAVNYGVRGQDASGLALRRLEADRAAAASSSDSASLIAKGVAVYALADDLGERGLDDAELVDGVRPLPMPMLPEVFLAGYDRVWQSRQPWTRSA